MGLSVSERDELMANVARRIQLQEEEGLSGDFVRLQAPEDVYKFQTGADAYTSEEGTVKKNDDSTVESARDSKERAVRKMDKTLKKLQDNKVKLSRLQCLLDHTNMLLAGDERALAKVCDITDSAVYHEIDELQGMSRAELKMQRLKYLAQKLKYEQKLAKCRVKLYKASLTPAQEQQKTASVV